MEIVFFLLLLLVLDDALGNSVLNWQVDLGQAMILMENIQIYYPLAFLRGFWVIVLRHKLER